METLWDTSNVTENQEKKAMSRTATKRTRDPEPDHIVHKDKDLRIPNTTPEKVA